MDPVPFGRYVLTERLAGGGMAEIFLGHQEGPGGFRKQVVIKRILPHFSEHPEFVRMFFDEARVMARFRHPSLVQVFDFGEADGVHYLAMEHLDGCDLQRVLRRAAGGGEPVPFAVAAAVGVAVCDGLAYVHGFTDEDGRALQVVHRDISPPNVMLTREGEVKLLDFGVAYSAVKSVETRSGVLKGKQPYMSPEQARGEALDGRSDLFSLGIVLHELLTAAPLFQKDAGEWATLRALLDAPIPSPRERRPDVPPDLEAVVLRALERDPERRYGSAEELGRALEACLVGLGAGRPVALVRSFVAGMCEPSHAEAPAAGTPRHAEVPAAGASMPAQAPADPSPGAPGRRLRRKDLGGPEPEGPQAAPIPAGRRLRRKDLEAPASGSAALSPPVPAGDPDAAAAGLGAAEAPEIPGTPLADAESTPVDAAGPASMAAAGVPSEAEAIPEASAASGPSASARGAAPAGQGADPYDPGAFGRAHPAPAPRVAEAPKPGSNPLVFVLVFLVAAGVGVGGLWFWGEHRTRPAGELFGSDAPPIPGHLEGAAEVDSADPAAPGRSSAGTDGAAQARPARAARRDTAAGKRDASGADRKPRARPAAADARPAAASDVPTGTLVVQCKPSCVIRIDGEIRGRSPGDPLQLPAGSYMVQVVEETSHHTRARKVLVAPRRVRIEKFDLSGGPDDFFEMTGTEEW